MLVFVTDYLLQIKSIWSHKKETGRKPVNIWHAIIVFTIENNSPFQSLIGPKGVHHKVAGQDVHPMLYLYCCFLPYFHENVPGPNYGVSECVKKHVADMWLSRAMYFTCRFAYLWTAKEIKSMYSSAEGIESCLLSAFKEQMTSATAVGLE